MQTFTLKSPIWYYKLGNRASNPGIPKPGIPDNFQYRNSRKIRTAIPGFSGYIYFCTLRKLRSVNLLPAPHGHSERLIKLPVCGHFSRTKKRRRSTFFILFSFFGFFGFNLFLVYFIEFIYVYLRINFVSVLNVLQCSVNKIKEMLFGLNL